MRRREYLVAAVAGVLAGCSGTNNGASGTVPGSTTSPNVSRTTTCTAGQDDLPVPAGELRTALPRDAIPAIVDPAFGEDWSDLTVPEDSLYDGDGPKLPDDAPVVGVDHGGDARAYPLRVLNWHEMVNDVVPAAADGAGDEEGVTLPLLVTYCPLCGSALAFERRVDGAVTTFGVSGHLWCENLVMYDDRTESLWSQIQGVAIRGQRTGEELSLLPTSLTTWREWRASHPDTRVLLPPPRSSTVSGRDATFDYFSSKYPDADEQVVGYDGESDGLHPRALVIGVVADGTVRAYPFGTIVELDVVNDTVGDRPVVVSSAPGGTMVAYDRRVAGEPRRFAADGEGHLRAAGSRWERTTGRAVDGPHEGVRLEDVSGSSPMFWRAWSEFHPDTTVYERE